MKKDEKNNMGKLITSPLLVLGISTLMFATVSADDFDYEEFVEEHQDAFDNVKNGNDNDSNDYNYDMNNVDNYNFDMNNPSGGSPAAAPSGENWSDWANDFADNFNFDMNNPSGGNSGTVLDAASLGIDPVALGNIISEQTAQQASGISETAAEVVAEAAKKYDPSGREYDYKVGNRYYKILPDNQKMYWYDNSYLTKELRESLKADQERRLAEAKQSRDRLNDQMRGGNRKTRGSFRTPTTRQSPSRRRR